MTIPNFPEVYKGLVLFNGTPASFAGAQVYATPVDEPDRVVGPPVPVAEDGIYINLVVQGVNPGTDIAFHLRLSNRQDFISTITDTYNPGQIHIKDGFTLPFEGEISTGDEGEGDNQPPPNPPVGLCIRLDNIVDDLDMLIADLLEVRLFMKERVEGE